MFFSVFVCMASLFVLIWLLRSSQVSLGLPIAYLSMLLLIHVPGAIAHMVDLNDVLRLHEITAIGIGLTAIGTACFVVGVGIAHFRATRPVPKPATRSIFWKFCLIGGWFITSVSFVIKVPSITALLTRGGPVWMLAILLALRSAIKRGDRVAKWRWFAALSAYPLLILLLGGFLSFGSMAVLIVLSGLAVTTRSTMRVALSVVGLGVFGISVFLSYFEHRDSIRAAVWGGQSTEARIDASMAAVYDISFFNPSNPRHLQALDARLNQNFFVGLAAARLDNGRVEYLHGRSLTEGAMALVPRALWADKPVTAGSPKIVSEMTGLQLSPTTSFGVGNVMEFYINFGVAGVIIGFLALGYILGRLDRQAATADAVGDLGGTFMYFLIAVALIQPNGSIVEMVGGGGAALLASYGWKWLWGRWPKPVTRRVTGLAPRSAPRPAPRPAAQAS